LRGEAKAYCLTVSKVFKRYYFSKELYRKVFRIRGTDSQIFDAQNWNADFPYLVDVFSFLFTPVEKRST